MAFQQGAREVVGKWLFTLARCGAIGGTSGSRPPRSPCFPILPKVTIRGWRWGTWWQMPQGTRGTMTGAHLGDRGACRRRSCSASAAPREGGRRRGHADGRHHPRSIARLFSPDSATNMTRKLTTCFYAHGPDRTFLKRPPTLPSSQPPQASSLSSPHRPPEGTCTALKPHVSSVGRDRSGANALYT